MSQEYAVKLMALHEQAKADEYYRSFLEEYRQADRQLLPIRKLPWQLILGA